MTFREKLEAAWARSNSLLCVGLDPEPALLPDGFGPDDVAAFNRAIIEATADLVCAYKPNVAFYEGLGPERGYAALRETLAAIPPHIITLADAKRGDVEHTARAYARALFDDLGFDSATVNAYLGRDSVEPWIERGEHGAFVVTRTSNPGAPDLQDLPVQTEGGARPLYEIVAERARSWDTRRNVGLVTGATYPEEMRRLRELCPDMPFLVPGIGPQAGSLEAAVRAGLDARGQGLVVSASRGVTYASRGADFAAAARREALRLRDEINVVRRQLAAAGS
jgi:orotidine-5'-phosphate decarboxylase